MITFDREPDSYKHWKVDVNENRATLFLDVSEKDGILLSFSDNIGFFIFQLIFNFLSL